MGTSPARVPVDVGSVIADTYKIEALLGQGGMGSVFLASHQRLAGRRVAIKILHTEIEDADVIARFKREAEIAARLNHPNIVGVIDYNVAPDGTPYLVLDYLEGETLAQRLARGPLPLDQVASIVRQVGSALAAAHRASIVHRDLKPQNIFLVPTEAFGHGVELAKVLDFGISKIRGSQTVKTQDSALLGTPQYMAPEQATGQHASVDGRTDVFAFGAIVYEMLTGEPAFPGASIPEVMFKVVYEQPVPLAQRAPGTPPAIADAVARAMAKAPAERFASVIEFVEAITGKPVTLPHGPAPVAPAASQAPSAARGITTGEAFARTMGSGDFGGAPPAAEQATHAASAAGTPQLLPAAAATQSPPTVDLRAPAASPPPRPRSLRTIAAIALAAAALAGGAVYAVTRDRAPREPVPAHSSSATRMAASEPPTPGRRDPRAADHPSGATGAPAKAPHADPARIARTERASPEADSPDEPAAAAEPPSEGGARSHAGEPGRPHDGRIASASHDARTPPPRGGALPGAGSERAGKPGGAGRSAAELGDANAGRTAPPEPDDDDREGGDDDTHAKLKQATAALDRHDYDLAERLANAVINSAASSRQRATARFLHGTVQCVARNDQEAAQIDLRNLTGFRALRARLVGVCRNHGILMP